MAFISPKNVIAPFTNKVHLATIAFVVILFAAFRAMGGAFSMQQSGAGQQSGVGTVKGPRSVVSQPMLTEVEPGILLDDLSDDLESELGANSQKATRGGADGVGRVTPRQGTAQSEPANDLDEIIRRLNSR